MFLRSLSFAVLSLLFTAAPLLAQDEPTTDKPAAAAAPKADKYHRLPPYYRDVATDEQKEKIYSIQEDYGPQLEALKKQMAALTKKRDAEVKAVLTQQQHTLIDKLASDAKAKRKAFASAFQEAIKKAKAEAAAKVEAAEKAGN